MSTVEIFKAIFAFLKNIWSELPKENQQKIMMTIAEGFEEMLRAFYRFCKQQGQQT